MTAEVAVPTPDPGLIDKGGDGILAYGALFVVAIMALLLGLAIRSLSQRDKLIGEMVKGGTEAAKETAKAHMAVAVTLARIESKLGVTPMGADHEPG